MHKNKLSLLLIIFTLSGISALIYQICWQRLLFKSFGIDIKSITIVVSVFMLGLGIGAAIGGRLADKFPNKILLLFSLAELSIGIFGYFSHLLINQISSLFILSSVTAIALVNFFVLLIPTALMGSTLPMLTFFLNLHYHNIGESIGKLYFFNTAGAAIGAFSTAFFIFDYLTLSQTIYTAAAINLIVAISAFFLGKNHE